MSHQAPQPQNQTAWLIGGVVGVFVATLAAVVAIALAVEDGARASSLIGLLLGSVASCITGLLALAKIQDVASSVTRVDRRTEDLSNGLMDAKIRAAVSEVLPDHLVDPAVRDQVAQDRVTRDVHNQTTPAV